MISHALTIIVNELTRQLEGYGRLALPAVELGNFAEGFPSGGGDGAVARNVLVLSMVNLKEEKALKNLPNVVRDRAAETARYRNPPVFLNVLVLLAATHTRYADALLMLSRAIRFFQSKKLFTDENVPAESTSTNAPDNDRDRLRTFRLAFDLYSPSMEEVNHLWGTLGGKQYPFVLYMMRLVELQFLEEEIESPLITNVTWDLHHRNATE